MNFLTAVFIGKPRLTRAGDRATFIVMDNGQTIWTRGHIDIDDLRAIPPLEGRSGVFALLVYSAYEKTGESIENKSFDFSGK